MSKKIRKVKIVNKANGPDAKTIKRDLEEARKHGYPEPLDDPKERADRFVSPAEGITIIFPEEEEK